MQPVVPGLSLKTRGHVRSRLGWQRELGALLLGSGEAAWFSVQFRLCSDCLSCSGVNVLFREKKEL